MLTMFLFFFAPAMRHPILYISHTALIIRRKNPCSVSIRIARNSSVNNADIIVFITV